MGEVLTNAELKECYTQDKDVIQFRFWKKGDIFIRVHLGAFFSCITFPGDLKRAKRNSTDLFDEIRNRRVLGVGVHNFDRSVYLDFDDDYFLVFKMHGQRSNIILFQGEDSVRVFKNRLKQDQSLNKADLEKNLPEFDLMVENEWNVQKTFPVLGKDIIEELYADNWNSLSDDQKWSKLLGTIELYKNVTGGRVVESGDQVKLTILSGDEGGNYKNPIELVTRFSTEFLGRHSYNSLKRSGETLLNQLIRKSHTYITKTRKNLNKVESEINHSIQADLIMANLHQIPEGVSEVKLPTFDGSGDITIKFKQGVSPIKQAENLYRKGKNKKIEISTIKRNIAQKEKELTELEEQLTALKEADNISSLKDILSRYKKKKSEISSSEFLEFEFDGFKIKVGKNAKNNDKLTLQGYKEDLWLHVKDARGSHVLLKYRSDRKFSKIAIEKAAQLAAYYSKRSTEGLVPVIFTPKKYVRKRKGDPAGAVVVDREEVILVEPEKW